MLFFFCVNRSSYCQMVYRMCALRDFRNIKKNDFSDLIECKRTLSHESDCWEKVYIRGKCFIKGSRTFTNTTFYNGARVCNSSTIYDETQIYDMFLIFSIVRLYDNAEVDGYKNFLSDKKLHIGSCILHGTKKVKNNAKEVSVELIAFAFSEVICVFAFRINKYSANNWYESMDLAAFIGLFLCHLLESLMERIKVLSVFYYTWHM